MKSKSMCVGCRNNFYNHPARDGCWHFPTATVVKRLMIHRDQMPPYKGVKPQATLSCWYGDTGMRAVDPQAITSDGYWR